MPIYFIDFTEEQFQRGNARAPLGFVYNVMPAGAFGEIGPDREVGHITATNYTAAGPETDPELVYELTKVIAEHSEELGEYHAAGKGITIEVLAGGNITERNIHPEALRYFTEQGVEVAE